jgi:hypothetical protein
MKYHKLKVHQMYYATALRHILMRIAALSTSKLKNGSYKNQISKLISSN